MDSMGIRHPTTARGGVGVLQSMPHVPGACTVKLYGLSMHTPC